MTPHIETPEHEHRDPRAGRGNGKVSGTSKAHIDVRQQNYGATKARAPGRINTVINWFRSGNGRRQK